MDPAWASIGIGVFSSLVTGTVWYGALRGWMARREEREANQGLVSARVQLVQDEHGRTLGDLSGRVRVLENEMDLRPPPVDYVR